MAEAFFQVAQAVIISRRIKSVPVLKCFHEDNRQLKRVGIAPAVVPVEIRLFAFVNPAAEPKLKNSR